MKKAFKFSIIALLFNVSVYSQTINFTSASLEEIMAKARSENKAIFIDVTAKRCSPCRWMEKNVFTDSSVAKYFNATFLNFKLDADDNNHREFINRYSINSFPTYLFFSPSGQLAYATGGKSDAGDFLNEAKIAFAETQLIKPIAVWNEEYKNHENDTTFLYKYIKRRSNSGLPNGNLIEKYLKLLTEEQRYSFQTINLLLENAATLIAPGIAYETALNSRKMMKEEEKTGDLIDILLMQYVTGLLEDAVKRQDETRLELMYPLAGTIKNPEFIIKGYELDLRKNYYHGIGNYPQYLILSEQYINQYILNPQDLTLLSDTMSVIMSLNRTAWGFYEHSEDMSNLRKALNWSQKSIDLLNLFPQYKSELYPLIMDTKASLLYKLGEKNLAIETMQYATDSVPDDEYSVEMKKEYNKKLEMMKGER